MSPNKNKGPQGGLTLVLILALIGASVFKADTVVVDYVCLAVATWLIIEQNRS